MEGYFLEVNNAAEQITGYSNGELVGMNFSEIMSKKELETVNSRYQQTIEGDTARYETKIYQKDGHEVYLNVKNISIIVDGTIKGVYGIAKEITSEKKALEEFHLVKSRFESFVRDSKDSIHIIDNEGKVQFINDVFTEKDVTDSRQIMNKLKESEERYRNLVEASPQALVVHSEGKITYINQDGLDLLKATSISQVIGKPVMDFVYPSDRKQVFQRIQQAINQGKQGEMLEERFITLDGDLIYAETASVQIQDHGKTSVLVMFRDVTTKRRAEKAMRDSEERFRIIAEHTLDMIRVLNPNGKVIYCSPSVENILGYPIRSLIGKSFFDLIHPDDVDNAKRNFENIFITKEFYQIDFRSIHLDGHSLWLNSDFVPVISQEGEIEKINVISGDITEKKRKEEKLAKMAYYDHLTGLPNRRLFLDRFQQAMYTTDRTGKITALMVLDCDKFKAINDTFGNDIGDEVIKEFSRRIKLSLRKTDTLSRVGGDEFTIVLPELKNEIEVVEVSKRILKVV